MFDIHDVALDVQAGASDETGPFPAWVLFIWTVNDMVPETFYTTKEPRVVHDEPAPGWQTEHYDKARVLMPPEDSGNKVAIVADDMSLYPVWDQAMQIVVSGNIHKH